MEMDMDMDIIKPIILCGGGGERLWPLSRRSLPKQFVPMFGENNPLSQTLCLSLIHI